MCDYRLVFFAEGFAQLGILHLVIFPRCRRAFEVVDHALAFEDVCLLGLELTNFIAKIAQERLGFLESDVAAVIVTIEWAFGYDMNRRLRLVFKFQHHLLVLPSDLGGVLQNLFLLVLRNTRLAHQVVEVVKFWVGAVHGRD